MKKISSLFLKTTIIIVTITQTISAMDANTPPPLDKAWNWYGAPKLENVISMPLRQLAIPPVSNIKAPRVAILDEYINPQACPIAQSCLIGAPAHYNFYEHDHGTHVANTVKAICPTARIHTDLGIGQSYNLVSALKRVADKKSIEIINMSLGCKKEYLYSLDKGTPTYNALVKVASAGKIMVKSLGNEYDKYSHSDHQKYVQTLMHLAEDPALKGRLLLVTNSSYRANDDLLHSSSNRPHRVCPYVITAPGTDITAKTSTFQEKTYTGTSMAAPMVSGMIAQLLYDFNKERIDFKQFGFDSDSSFKDFIILNLLNNARKKSLKGKVLGVEFGQGIINCKNTREAIRNTLISKIMNKLPKPIFIPGPAQQPKPLIAIQPAKPMQPIINIPADFNGFFYVNLYHDLTLDANHMDPHGKNQYGINHYKGWGFNEKRPYLIPTDFNGLIYVYMHSDLTKDVANQNPEQKHQYGYNHYVGYGHREGRQYKPGSDYRPGLKYIRK